MDNISVRAMKGGILLTAVNYVNSILGILVSMIVISELGPTLFGINKVLFSIFSLLITILIGILNIPYTRELSATIARKDQKFFNIVLSTGILSYTLATTISIVAYLIIGFFYILRIFSNSIRLIIISLIAISMLPRGFYIFIQQTLRSIFRYREMSILSIILNLAYISGVIYVFIFQNTQMMRSASLINI